MTKATVDALSGMHGLFAQVCVDKLQELEPINKMTEEGPQTVGWKRAIKSGDMNAIRAFLNDNKITADIGSNAGLQALENELAKEKRYSDNVVGLPTPQQAVNQ